MESRLEIVTASTTAAPVSNKLTAAIDAHDMPNAFIQAVMPELDGNARVIMKITGVLVEMLVPLPPDSTDRIWSMRRGFSRFPLPSPEWQVEA